MKNKQKWVIKRVPKIAIKRVSAFSFEAASLTITAMSQSLLDPVSPFDTLPYIMSDMIERAIP